MISLEIEMGSSLCISFFARMHKAPSKETRCFAVARKSSGANAATPCCEYIVRIIELHLLCKIVK